MNNWKLDDIIFLKTKENLINIALKNDIIVKEWTECIIDSLDSRTIKYLNSKLESGELKFNL